MWSRSRPTVVVLVLALAMLAAACGGTDDGGTDDQSLPPNPAGSGDDAVENPVSLGEAIASTGDDPIAVEGFVVIDAAGARLCEALAESFPPQCGGGHLDIQNPEILTELPLIEEGSTQWTEGYVVLLGEIDGNELTVTATSF